MITALLIVAFVAWVLVAVALAAQGLGAERLSWAPRGSTRCVSVTAVTAEQIVRLAASPTNRQAVNAEPIAKRWLAGTAVEVRNLDRWLPAVVLSTGWWSARELHGPAGDRVEVEMAGTGHRAVVSEEYNGRANIRLSICARARNGPDARS